VSGVGATTQGDPEPLGVSLTPAGINIAVWSAHADAIEFCLFDDTGDREIARLLLPGRTGPVGARATPCAPTAPSRPSAASVSTPTSCWSTPTPWL
jgi:pullulanase/glycogen debranching enzyme